MKQLLLIVLVLAGCSTQITEPLQVTIEANKQQVAAFEPVTITAHIAAGGQPVLEGAEIDFELINPSGQTIGTVNPTNHQDGSYSIETSFDAAGMYRIISHVDYEQLHEMPIAEVTVQ